MLRAVLFDLDGTLLDTAPDMGGALNELRADHDLEPLPAAVIRPWVSHGAAALVRLGFGDCEPQRFESLRLRFLEIYASRLAQSTSLFEGGRELLEALDGEGIPWGVVTNKPAWLTLPLLEALDLKRRLRVVVSGDSLPEKKPHPAPLLLAASTLAQPPAACAYVGDAERDMVAARAAGMPAVLAGFGYIDPGAAWRDWPHAVRIESLAELWPWLRRAGIRRDAAPVMS